MDSEAIKSIAKTMRDYGISHLKCGDLEIQFGSATPQVSQANYFAKPPDDNAASDPIKHQVEQLNSLMKLSDTELVDKLFPEPKEEAAE